MIKVEKVVAKRYLEITEDGHTGTFTKGETYYARRSKKGYLVVKSNEGQWIAFHNWKLIRRDVLGHNFDRVGEMFFKNLKELKRMSV